MPDVPVVGGETFSMELGSTLNPSKLSSFAAVFRTLNTSLTIALWLNFISKSTITLPHLKTKIVTSLHRAHTIKEVSEFVPGLMLMIVIIKIVERF